ncbi:MAG: DUF5320 domain-containing protein [Lachnospiraceae bacterium]|nr:DUF5320 domain-containing protein [Lachnospiraceae bacterium]
MPRRDGTGPIGMGAKTGRGVGYCNTTLDVNSNQVANYGGNRCGNRRGNKGQLSVAGLSGFCRKNFLKGKFGIDEKAFLSQQETLLESQLKHVKERLSEMSKETE